MTISAPNAILQRTLDDLEGWHIFALVNEQRRVLRKLGTLREFTYALGQMACLIGANFKLRIAANSGAAGAWQTGADGLFSPAVTVDELFQAVTGEDSPLVYSVLHAVFKEEWPAGAYDVVEGFKATRNAMVYLVRLVFHTRWSPMADMTGNVAVSLRRQVEAALKPFGKTGLTLHNEALLRELTSNLGYCHLMATQDVEKEAA